MRRDESALAPRAPGLRVHATPRFVGRGRERAWLTRCLEEALAGRPRVVMLSGEAGLGKTRLAREIEALARVARVRVCRGRAYEDLPLPYLPFVEILRDQLDEIPEAVRRVLGDDAERLLAVARGEPLPASGSSLVPAGNSAETRIGLFVSLCRATLALSRLRPTLLVLDDLHWADEATIDQLAHLVFALSDADDATPLLVLGLHRAPAAGEPLARALARFAREPVLATLELACLDESEVTELVTDLGISRPSRRLATEIHAASAGNPLFVEELVQELVRREWIEERGGFQVTTKPVEELELPASPTAAIAARSAALGDRCRTALTFAAFLGDRCALPVLAAASGIPRRSSSSSWTRRAGTGSCAATASSSSSRIRSCVTCSTRSRARPADDTCTGTSPRASSSTTAPPPATTRSRSRITWPAQDPAASPRS